MPTRSGTALARASTTPTISAAAASASRRMAIGTVPACPGDPVTLTRCRVPPAMAVTTPERQALVEQHRPLLDVHLDVGRDRARDRGAPRR